MITLSRREPLVTSLTRILWHHQKRRSSFLSSTLANCSLIKASEHASSSSSSFNFSKIQRMIHYLPITRFSPEEEMVRETARNWARGELQPFVREMEQTGQLRPEILNQLFAQGFMSLEISRDDDESLSFTGACLVIEELSRIDPSVAILVDIHNTLVVNAVRFWGSPDLQNDWLPRLGTDCIGAFALSESASGSDAFSLQTRADLQGDYYVLNGNKLWISNAREAGVFLVFATVDSSAGYKGITAFMVDATADGLSVGKPENKLGLCASATCPVSFDNVKVEIKNVLGEVGMGYKYCIGILNEGRIGIAAQQIGIAKGCMDVAMPYLQERKQFGIPIGDFQGMQHQVAQIATQIHAAEVMTYNACRLKEASAPFVKEASMAKYYASTVAEQTASKSIEWLGGLGFTKDTLVEKMYRDCKVGSIYEGTSNIQLQTIAKLLKEEFR